MGKVIYIKGVPSPQYRAQQIRQDRDQDLFVDMLNHHPDHIARSKAKGWAYVQKIAEEVAEERAREEDRERLLSVLAHISFFSLLALMVVMALW